MSEEVESVEPVFKLFLSEDTFGYETELAPEDCVFWLDVVRASIINKVIGENDE